VTTLKPQSEPLYNSTAIGTLAVDRLAVTFSTVRRGLGGLRPRLVSLAVPNVTANLSTASVPIVVLLYNGKAHQSTASVLYQLHIV